MNQLRPSQVLQRWTGLLLALLWVAIRAVPAAACPACYESSSPSVLATYYLSTLMLTLLPFAIIGVLVTVGLYLGRRTSEPPPAADAPALTEHP